MHIYAFFFSFYQLLFHLNVCFWLFYLHKVDMNKKIKTFNEFNAPAAAPVAEQQHSFWEKRLC